MLAIARPSLASMTEQLKSDVSGTTFVVNFSHSKVVKICQDRYAHLWVTPEALALWEELARDVYPHDDLNISIRNRFFLEQLKKFIGAHKNRAFVSIAAGFDKYPFLCKADFRSVECDLPNIMDFKKRQVEQWIKAKQLPLRNFINIISLFFHRSGIIKNYGF